MGASPSRAEVSGKGVLCEILRWMACISWRSVYTDSLSILTAMRFLGSQKAVVNF